MSCNVCVLKYTGATPAANTDPYVLFSTVAMAASGVGGNFAAMTKSHKFCLVLVNSGAGTLNLYASNDRGANWTQIDTTAVPASAGGIANPYEALVESLTDWKVEWVNTAAAAQTTWFLDMSLEPQRAPTA
jgi:hypothetical protein